MVESLRALAHAKINLALEVLGTRPDGYHEIDTILQEIDLADVVEVELASTWGIEVSGPRAAGTPCDNSNLAWRAAIALAERVHGRPVRIRLEKHIPAAGGLGGGASDAATVLRLLARLWPGVSSGDLEAAALSVGSDEAFFLVGGTARAQGRGERVSPLPSIAEHDVVLFVPPQTIETKTARMFAALDTSPFDAPLACEAFVATAPARISSADVFNAFERVAFDLFPWLAALWEDLERRVEAPVRLAGAGPCLFWIGPPGEGTSIAHRCAGANCDVILTRTVGR